MQIQAIYQDGKFIPLTPVDLVESDQPVTLEIIQLKTTKPEPAASQTQGGLAQQLADILGTASKQRPASSKQQDRETWISAVEENN